jgi:hypothetical protein
VISASVSTTSEGTSRHGTHFVQSQRRQHSAKLRSRTKRVTSRCRAALSCNLRATSVMPEQTALTRSSSVALSQHTLTMRCSSDFFFLSVPPVAVGPCSNFFCFSPVPPVAVSPHAQSSRLRALLRDRLLSQISLLVLRISFKPRSGTTFGFINHDLRICALRSMGSLQLLLLLLLLLVAATPVDLLLSLCNATSCKCPD